MNKLSIRVAAQSDFLLDICKLVEYARKQGYATTAGEFLRTPFQQAEYVRSGASKTFDSRHLQKMAADLQFFEIATGRYITTKAEIEFLGLFWESLHPKNRWGGNFKTFKDAPHFERKD